MTQAPRRDVAQAMFALRRPCGNCPFRKEGAIPLAPGRLEGIIKHLTSSDWNQFQCHKTVHNTKTGGSWDESGAYQATGQEAMCAGAIIYLEKLGQPSVGMRLGQVYGVYDPQALVSQFDEIIDPPD
jgi:hypothetical protein